MFIEKSQWNMKHIFILNKLNLHVNNNLFMIKLLRIVLSNEVKIIFYVDKYSYKKHSMNS